MTRLSVNVNKIATLRNARGGSEPAPVDAARRALVAGAHGITVHPRPDLRHIRPDDVRAIAVLLRQWPQAELNIEGNPFAPAASAYPGLIELVRETRPHQCTLVPDGDDQVTSDHGFDLIADVDRLREVVADLKALGTRVSVFVDAGGGDFSAFARLGLDRVEIYTGPYAASVGSDELKVANALEACVATARNAREAGLGVNAGHDLDRGNLGRFLTGVPGVLEVSIGHALVIDALELGLDAAVCAYLAVIDDAVKQEARGIKQ